jgi:hypothetical protein
MTRKGWECPICGRAWSPDVEQCHRCNGPKAEALKQQDDAFKQYAEMLKQPEPHRFQEPFAFGPGMAVPIAQYNPLPHSNFGDPRWGGKAVTILRKDDPSTYAQPGSGAGVPEQQPGFRK